MDPHSLPHLGSIPSLRSLNLSSNGITELTNGLANLSNITTFILDGNKLSPVCHDSLRLAHTSHVYNAAMAACILVPMMQLSTLSQNAVSKLALMPNLQSLDIASNGLTSFQSSNFPALVRLNLASNNIEDPHDIQVAPPNKQRFHPHLARLPLNPPSSHPTFDPRSPCDGLPLGRP